MVRTDRVACYGHRILGLAHDAGAPGQDSRSQAGRESEVVAIEGRLGQARRFGEMISHSASGL